MAQGPLTRATAAVSILALGTAVEVAAHQTPALTAADFAVGAGIGCAGAYLLGRAPRAAFLALAVAVTWFMGTLAGASSDALSGIGAALLIVYRGPLLHLLGAATPHRIARLPAWTLAAAGWGAAVLPLAAAGPATAALAAVMAVSAGASASRAAADRRSVLAAAAGAAGQLAVIWTLAALGAGSETVLLVLNDVAVAGSALIALTAAAGWWTRGAARSVVIELGPRQRRPGQPLTVRLGRALADPDLEIRYALDGRDWFDEQGRPAPMPGADGRHVTRVDALEAGEVALVYGHNAMPDPRLAVAAAAAAALALDTARLEAEARRRAAEIQASRLRMLGVADAERQTLEQNLSDGVLVRLRRVERLLADEGERLTSERAELDEAVGELLALARGLYPPALDRTDLARALSEVAERSPTTTTVEVRGDLRVLPETHRAAVWFVCSEAMANIARHAQASRAAVIVAQTDDALELEIRDDGRGGATLTRGLRGLADRVDALGGTLVLSSPAGGPTVIRVGIPAAGSPGAGRAAHPSS